MKYTLKIILLVLLFASSCEVVPEIELDTTLLSTEIDDCTLLYDNSVEGKVKGEYAIGSKDIFLRAINEAIYIMDFTDRQSAIDNTLISLQDDKEIFLSNMLSGPQCLIFDGTASIDCGPASQYYGSAFTFEAWINPSEWTGGSIFGAEGVGDNGIYGMLLRFAENVEGAIDFTIANGTWTSCITAENSISLNEWTHIACTFDSENIKVYINSVLSAELVIGAYIPEGEVNFIVGDLGFFNNRFFWGKMYDIRIWNVIRTEEQINENYTIFLTGEEEGLTANWPFTTKESNTVLDITGNIQAILTNTIWTDLDNDIY